MTSRREVLIRILALLQRKTLIETKKSHIRKLKMALFDCAINEKKKLQCWRRTRHLSSLFRPHPGRFDSSRVPTPGNLPSKTKKMLLPGDQPGGGRAGCRWNWLLTKLQGRQQRQPQKVTSFCTFLYRPSTTTTWNDHILNFFVDGNGKAINSIISVRTRAWPPLFSSNINSPLLSNWANWNNRKMVWKDEESIFFNFTVL